MDLVKIYLKEKKESLVSNIKLIIKIPIKKSSTSNQPKW